ncbi:hypothetical protein B0H17DRAFT_1033161 [Mycena rosella]|uniref:Uncharacterized protein n=1 Tax=Mycena rosella TaxID=1033263 RepID=A0AAD7GXP0_MYCRO|nr:hypothetical protein B0H17DRAFT_1033161 [Mycena rosella]
MAVAPSPHPPTPSLHPDTAVEFLQRPAMPPHRLPSFRLDSAAADAEKTYGSAPESVRARSTAPSPRSYTHTLSAFKLVQTSVRPLLTAAKHPRILASLLAHLSWRASWALLSTCRDCRDFFSYPELKDVILSRFVPGYATCLRISDPLRLQNVPVALADLHLLMISQRVIFHRYPMHALTCLSGLPPDEERTLRLAILTQAHSRFVLLLQALAHSSSMPPPPEQDEIEWRPPLLDLSLRQLKFPAPLSYVSAPAVVAEPAVPPRSGRSRKSADSARVDGRPPLDSRSLSRAGSRLSLFRGSSTKVPPPPVSEPRSLKHFASGWRHSLSRASGSTSDDEWGRKPLERPHRRFASANLSSDSSSSISPSPPFSRDSTLGTSSPIRRDIPHHDLLLATSRVRAPVLRVFVPCSKLELSDDSDGIALCEDQLYESGLWSHLSTGDIVCNFGYVPPHTPDEPGSSDGSLADSAGSEPALQNRRKWLLFDGQSLVPFSPPEPLPLRNPFILPSPCYYTHIMPPLANPVFITRCFPPCDDIPQLALVSLSTKVRSPHSPTGFALVKKPMWTARVWKQVAENDEIGLGWQGEWVLEGEGTREGQKALIDCLRGVKGPLREWQFVREKSVGNRLWFRLINTFSTKRENPRSRAASALV